MVDDIAEHFAASGRTPKGRRALAAIYRATHALVVQHGIDGTSLDAVADAAEMSQAALRHYFATRHELLTAFFVAATTWFRTGVTELLADASAPARTKLERCLAWHLEYMEHVDTALWLEASAYWLRHPTPRETRDEFYRWLLGRYAQLIGAMRPDLDAREHSLRAYTVLTLVLGAWVTHGRGSAVPVAGGVSRRRQMLVDAALEIATR